MNSPVFSFLSDFVFLLLLFIQIPSSLSKDDLYTACSKKFECGNISAVFPFWGAGRSPACGIHELELKCNENNITTMNINQVSYRVLEINQSSQTLRIAREDYSVGLCPPQFMNSTFNPKIFEPVEGYKFFTINYGCEDATTTKTGPKTFTCKINDVNNRSDDIEEGEFGPGECNGSVTVPVSVKDAPPVWDMAAWERIMAAFEEQLTKRFEVGWKVDWECRECSNSSGVCGFDNHGTIPETTKPILLTHNSISFALLPLAGMNSSVFSFLSDFVFLLLLFIQIPSSLSDDNLYTACSKEFVCGGISAGFPFWGNGRPSECGIPELELKCHENNSATMNISQVAYRVLEINREFKILRIAREDYSDGLCKPHFMNSTFNLKIFELIEDYRYFTLIYGCEDAPITITGPRPFKCKINEVDDQRVYIQKENGPGECNGSVTVPVYVTYSPPVGNMPDLEEQLKEGFKVRWKDDMECWECKRRWGVCGFDNVANQATCYYQGLSTASAVVIGLFFGCWVLFIVQRRKRKSAAQVKSKGLPVATPPSSKGPATSTNLSQTTSFLTSSKSSLEKGSVLKDGRVVAVKRLFENNMRRAEQFMNEIEILAHLRHKNLQQASARY
ncbi:hypothetical protein SADUNF_Sadunf17G0110200 [Salix dunnii]|uniref:non-specific serine/threonine protein kinase n=1 Tax=Salix dunnii TaxID=1413687 RepID=A0A835MNN5_9ROSI|nr:hypothetical protein SADUNF_Sadunf17G0110200 [Salix dunnii]